MKRNALLGLVFALLILAVAIWLFVGSDDNSPSGGGAETDGPELADGSSKSESSADAEGDSKLDASKDSEASEDDEEEPLSIEPLLRGRVVGEGAGIAGATVRFFAVDKVERLVLGMEDLIPRGAEMPNIPVVIDRLKAALGKLRDLAIPVTTDENGEFVVQDVDPGGYILLTVADGWIFRAGDVVSLRLGETEETTIELDRGMQIAGRVITPTGVGVPGATVVAEYRPPGMPGVGKLVRRGLRLINGEFLKGPFEAKAAADGSFLLGSLPPGVYDLTASTSVGVESRLELVQTGTSNAVVVLGDGANLHGFFVDGDEVPVGGVEVKLERIEDRIQLPAIAAGFSNLANTVNEFLSDPPRQTTSTADGAFVFRGLGEGKYQLSVQQPGLLPLVRPIEVLWGKTHDLGALTVDRGRSIRGVVQTEDGEPIAGAVVMAAPGKMTFLNAGVVVNDLATGRLQVTTEEDGTFELSGLKRSKYRVTASRSGYAPSFESDVTADTDPLEMVLRRGETIRGKVLLKGTEDGVPGVAVRCRRIKAVTNDEGEFLLEGVAYFNDRDLFPFGGEARRERGGRDGREGVSIEVGAGESSEEDQEPERRLARIRAEKKGFLRDQDYIDFDDLPEEVVLEVLRAPAIEGVVRTPEGDPAPGALVRLTPAFPRELDELGFFDTAMIFLGVTVSDRDGKFRFEDFIIGDGGRLRVVADHILYARGKSDSFEFEENFSNEEPVEVTLVAGGTVKGVVTDGKDPIAGATVRLRKRREISEQEGMFMKMLGLPKGGDTAHTSKSGEFTYRNVVPGDYVVSAEVEGFTESTEEEISLEAGDERVLAFEMDPGGAIFGQVVDASGEPLPGARVRVIRESSSSKQMIDAQRFLGGSYKSVGAETDGSFRIDGLPSSTYIVIAQKKGYRRAELNMVEPSENALALQLVRSAMIRGQVVDVATGVAVTTFRVDLKSETDSSGNPWGRKREHSDPEGIFERDDLAPGVYDVEVSASGFVPSTLKIELLEGDLAEPRFTLARSGRLEGRVIDKLTGKPLADARVRLVADAGFVAASDSEGSKKKGVPRVGDDKTQAPEKSEEELRDEDMKAMREFFVARQLGGSVKTEADGSFVIDAVPSGPQVVVVSHGSFVQLEQRGVSVEIGEARSFDFAMEPGLHIAGRVVDSAGEPKEGRTVFVRGVSPGNRLVSKMARTSDGGLFRVDGLTPGSYRVLPFRGGGGFQAGGTISIDLDSSRTDLEMVLGD